MSVLVKFLIVGLLGTIVVNNVNGYYPPSYNSSHIVGGYPPYPNNSYPSYAGGNKAPYPNGSYSGYPSGIGPPYPSGGFPPYSSANKPPYPNGTYPGYPGGNQLPYPGGNQLPYPGGNQLPYPGRNQLPNPGGNQLPYPGRNQLPNPGGNQLPNPGRNQLPNPGGNQLPYPGGNQLPYPGGKPPSYPGGTVPGYPSGNKPKYPGGGSSSYPTSKIERVHVRGKPYLNGKKVSLTGDMKRSGTPASTKLQTDLCQSVSSGIMRDTTLSTSYQSCKLSHVGSESVETQLLFQGSELAKKGLKVKSSTFEQRVKSAILASKPTGFYYYGTVSKVSGSSRSAANTFIICIALYVMNKLC